MGSILHEGIIPSAATWRHLVTRGRHMANVDPTRPVDLNVDWRSTTIDRWLTGGPVVVYDSPPPLTATVDRSIQYEVGVAGTRLNDWLGIRANHWFVRRSFRKVTWRTPIGGSEYGGYEEMMNLINSNQDPPVDLYDLKGSDKGDNKIDSLTMEPSDTFLMGDKVISTTPERENDEFIKSSIDDLVPILRESEVTSVYDDLECSMPIDPPLPCTDVLGDAIVDIDLLLGEHLDTLLTEDREIDFNPSRDIEELERLLADDPVPVLRVFDKPLGNSDSVPISYDVTFLNPLFDFNDDYTLCYDNPLFDEEFEDISSLDPPESTPVIDESSLLVTPLPDPKHICLREVERFDPFFSLT
ncbi:hypothetical protein Tco_1317967 [Tanacetum coccineum]